MKSTGEHEKIIKANEECIKQAEGPINLKINANSFLKKLSNDF